MTPLENGKKRSFPGRFKSVLKSRWFLSATVLLLLYALSGFLLAPYVIKRTLPRVIEKTLDRRAAIGAVRINPFLLTVEAKDFTLAERDGEPIADFKRLFLDFETASLFRWAWMFREITLEQPGVNGIIDRDGELNIMRMLPDETEPSKAPDSSPARLILQSVRIVEGTIDVTDRRQSTPATVTITPLSIQLNDISTLPDRDGPYTLSAATGDGGSFSWSGEVRLHPFRSFGTLGFKDIQLATLWEFVRDSVNLKSPKGDIDVTMAYDVSVADETAQLALSDVMVQISDLALVLSGEKTPFLDLKTIGIDAATFSLQNRRLDLGRVSIGDGHAHLAVDSQGILNLQRMTATTGEGEPPRAESGAPAGDIAPWEVSTDAVIVTDVGIDYHDLSRRPEVNAGIETIGAGFSLNAAFGGTSPLVAVQGMAVELETLWIAAEDISRPLVQVHRLNLVDGGFDLENQAFTASRIGLQGGAIDLVRESDGRINLVPPEKGAVYREAEQAAASDTPWQFKSAVIEGADLSVVLSDRTVKPEEPMLTINPLSFALGNVDLTSPMAVEVSFTVKEGGSATLSATVDPSIPSVTSDIELKQLALPPFQPYLDPVALLLLEAGTVSTQGKLTYGKEGGDSMLAYDGGFSLEGLNLVDPGSDKTLFGFDHLKTSQLTLTLDPNRLEIDDIRLHKPDGEVVIDEKGSLNLVKVIKEPAQGDAPSGSAGGDAEEDPFPVRIRKLRIDGGDLLFADLSLVLPFSTRIHDFGGAVIGAATENDSRAQVALDGQIDEYGTAKIEGEIDLFDPKGYTNLGVAFDNVEMSNLSPYSGKFAGRRIDSGKLSLDLNYLIQKGQLQGKNQIVVDRIELGERIDSPKAVNLPLDLAVALLEDGNGVIDIGLPVKGDMESPEFSIGHLIGKALVNLITKIVSSPFRALGAVMGMDAEGLEWIAFAPGDDDVPPPEVEKLVTLAEALNKRPQLTLEVQGQYAPEADRRALQALSLRRTLSDRMGLELAPEDDPGPVDYSNPDVQAELEDLFKDRHGRKALKTFTSGVDGKSDAPAKAEGGGQEAVDTENIDPGKWSKALFARLAEDEMVPDAALLTLADARAQAVAGIVTGDKGIAKERVSTQPSIAAKKKDRVAARLSLGVAGK